MLVFYLAAIDNDESKNKFEYIYHKYYRFMLRTASSIIRDSSLAEDAVHETFVQLLKEIDSLRIDNEKSLQSYLYILTRERTIDFLRKWERRRGVLTDYENRSTSFDNFKEPEEIALTNLQLNKAVSILSDMPSIYRRTLVLRVKGYGSSDSGEPEYQLSFAAYRRPDWNPVPQTGSTDCHHPCTEAISVRNPRR